MYNIDDRELASHDDKPNQYEEMLGEIEVDIH
jgi:hypothetical protein